MREWPLNVGTQDWKDLLGRSPEPAVTAPPAPHPFRNPASSSLTPGRFLAPAAPVGRPVLSLTPLLARPLLLISSLTSGPLYTHLAWGLHRPLAPTALCPPSAQPPPSTDKTQGRELSINVGKHHSNGSKATTHPAVSGQGPLPQFPTVQQTNVLLTHPPTRTLFLHGPHCPWSAKSQRPGCTQGVSPPALADGGWASGRRGLSCQHLCHFWPLLSVTATRPGSSPGWN